MIARSTGKLIRQLPGLCGGDGQWKNNRDEVALEWQTQFGTIENAEEITAIELLHRSVSRHDGCWQAIDLLSIPSWNHNQSIAGSQSHRAGRFGRRSVSGRSGCGCQKAFSSFIEGSSPRARHHGVCWWMVAAFIQRKRQPAEYGRIRIPGHSFGICCVKCFFKGMETIDHRRTGTGGTTNAVGGQTRTLD